MRLQYAVAYKLEVLSEINESNNLAAVCRRKGLDERMVR